jgi:hypothetical protein
MKSFKNKEFYCSTKKNLVDKNFTVKINKKRAVGNGEGLKQLGQWRM